MQKNTTHIIQNVSEIQKICFPLLPGDIIFLFGDLGTGKTTLVRTWLRMHFADPSMIIRSPTYTYYQQYENIYHFDLYRLDHFDTFDLIGGNEILSNPQNISLIEWPEIIEPSICPTKSIYLHIEPDESRLANIYSHTNP